MRNGNLVLENESFPYDICLLLLGDVMYTSLDPTHFYFMHFFLHILIPYDSISSDRYLVVNFIFLIIMLLIWCYFYKLRIYFFDFLLLPWH